MHLMPYVDFLQLVLKLLSLPLLPHPPSHQRSVGRLGCSDVAQAGIFLQLQQLQHQQALSGQTVANVKFSGFWRFWLKKGGENEHKSFVWLAKANLLWNTGKYYENVTPFSPNCPTVSSSNNSNTVSLRLLLYCSCEAFPSLRQTRSL